VTDFAALPVRPVRRVMSFERAETMVGEQVDIKVPNVRSAGLLTDARSGEPFLAYYPLDRAVVEPVRSAIAEIEWTTTTLRAGTGQRNVSRTFGMAPRKAMIRRESCRPSGLAMSQPAQHDALVGLGVRLQAQLREFAPAAFDRDAETVAGVGEEWRLAEESLWTSGVVNRSSSLPYHRDRLNFPTWSAMPVFRRGMAGGHLHLPEYDITVECRDGWCVFFPGFEHLHGVTPMHPTVTGNKGYRYSVVYYALKGMKDCFTYAMELGQARRARTVREQGAAELLVSGETPKWITSGQKRDRR
jgi:hypothetical protein